MLRRIKQLKDEISKLRLRIGVAEHLLEDVRERLDRLENPTWLLPPESSE